MSTVFATLVSGGPIQAAFHNSIAAAINKIEKGSTFYGGLSAGAANAQTITLDPAPSALQAGKRVVFFAGYTNTADVYLNTNSLGAVYFRRPDKSVCAPGDIQAGGLVACVFDGTYWVLENFDDASNFLFGDGSSGAGAIGSNTTLTEAKFYTSLSITAAFTLFTDDYPIFVRDTLTMGALARISSNGNDASGGTGGAATGGNFLGGGSAGGNSTAGGTDLNTNTVPGAGGAGGTGGASGGDGGLVFGSAQWAAKAGKYELFGKPLYGGTGGGGGGNGGGTGGGGGGGAGVVVVFARRLSGSGILEAKGGNGAAGSGGTSGGGGGGGGGLVLLVTRTPNNPFTLTVTAGTGGAGTGGVGANGSSGLAVYLGA